MNDGIHTLSQTLRELVLKELDPGERVMWSAQPLPGAYMKMSIPFVVFGAIWMAILSPILVAAWSEKEISGPAGIGIKVFMLPFVLVGLGMLTSPIWLRNRAKHSVYVITDRRALIFRKTLGSTLIKSFLPHQLQGLKRQQRNDGSGDIIIDYETVYHKGRPSARAVGFLSVPHVKQVEDMLETLASADLSRR